MNEERDLEIEERDREIEKYKKKVEERDREIEECREEIKQYREEIEGYDEYEHDIRAILLWGVAAGADVEHLRAGIHNDGRLLSRNTDNAVRCALQNIGLSRVRRDLFCAWCEARMASDLSVPLVSGEEICRACAIRAAHICKEES